MARLEDLVPSQRESLEALECLAPIDTAFEAKRPLEQCRVALVSSAGLMRRGDDNVPGNSADYRSFDRSCPDRDILVNHLSINFDRTAVAEDINTVFPRQILSAMEAEGIIQKAAKTHYSFMGATNPSALETSVKQLSEELHQADINTVCLLPV